VTNTSALWYVPFLHDPLSNHCIVRRLHRTPDWKVPRRLVLPQLCCAPHRRQPTIKLVQANRRQRRGRTNETAPRTSAPPDVTAVQTFPRYRSMPLLFSEQFDLRAVYQKVTTLLFLPGTSTSDADGGDPTTACTFCSVAACRCRLCCLFEPLRLDVGVGWQ
jgi:hypothetical protein